MSENSTLSNVKKLSDLTLSMDNTHKLSKTSLKVLNKILLDQQSILIELINSGNDIDQDFKELLNKVQSKSFKSAEEYELLKYHLEEVITSLTAVNKIMTNLSDKLKETLPIMEYMNNELIKEKTNFDENKYDECLQKITEKLQIPDDETLDRTILDTVNTEMEILSSPSGDIDYIK